MRKAAIVLAVVIFSLALFSGVNQAFAAEKLGYVDLSRAFSEYNKTKGYDKNLSDKEKDYTTERDKKVADLKAFQDKLNLLSDKERDAKKNDLQAKVKSFQDYDRQKQDELRKEQEAKMKELLGDIQEAVKQYAEKEGYTFIFNDRVLVYQTKTADITNQIVEILNKKK